MENANYKSGFVTLIGRPNVGKSTLMNHLIGQKIAITSNKPQTTRNRIQTVYTSEQGQIIFLDTPGIHKAKNKLGEYMVTAAEQTLKEVDVVLWLVEPTDTVGKGELHIVEKLRSVHVPVILVLNKMDTVDKREIPRYLDVYRELFDFADAIPVCALRGLHMEEVIQAIFRYLPYGPQYYDEDTVTDQPQRQIVAELIREKALRCMEEEIPHGIAVSIEYMEERPAGSEKKKTNRAEAARKRNRHTHVHDHQKGKNSDAVNGQSGGEVDKSGSEGKLVKGLAEKTGKPENTGKLRKESAGTADKSGNIDETRKGSASANNIADDADLGRRGRAEVRLREDSDWIMDIEATIICEKESHKGMVIGKQGAMLRKIGSQARYEIEQMLEEPVNLQLWVKVKKDWRDSDFMIKNFGYDKKELE